MDNIFEMIGKLNGSNNNSNENQIPKEIVDQYPYGQFPLRYTKSGQEIIRKQSESRYSYNPQPNQIDESTNQSDKLNLSMLLPIIQMLSGGKKNSKDIMQIFSKLIFKDNPDMQKLFSMLPNLKGAEVKKQEDSFPNTNKVEISSLKKID